MNNNDQWFEPNTKVIRVARATDFGVFSTTPSPLPGTEFGKVLCVRFCHAAPLGNGVFFVGVDHISNVGCLARCFRRVEEIQLCVRAAEKFRQPQTESV
jgi:hypothetical protein